ncbi:MAG: serine/threonine-protein kinase [Pirellulales bacterium]
MKCTDCGMPLDGVTIQASGYLECPQCGKAIQSNDHGKEEPVKSLQDDYSRFEMVEYIGQGTSGTVYKAFDKELRRYVAIKTPKDSAPNSQSEVLLKEARNASQLHHPNIVTIHDVIQLESTIHIVSEYIEGSSLKVWLDKHELDDETTCSIVIQICRAVAFAHQADIIHRDIKPANIVMDSQNKPHLLDFGLSYSRSLSLSSKRLGLPIGTPAFMSPEQVRGVTERIDHRTDIYSIGVVLYQMLTNRLPYSGSGDELYAKILGETPLSPRQINPKIPASLNAIVMQAMAKEPDGRYSDANQLADDLENYLQGRAVKAYGKWELRTIKHFARRRFAAGMAVSSMAGLAGMYWWMEHRSQDSTGSSGQISEPDLKNVMIDVDGPSGKLYCQRLQPEDGQLEAERLEVESGREFKLRSGFYRFTYEYGDEISMFIELFLNSMCVPC